MADILTGILIGAAAVFVLRKMWKDKKAGKTGCGGNCAGCSGCKGMQEQDGK